jgi:sugar/nucleoside kinase (ribokinase family)
MFHMVSLEPVDYLVIGHITVDLTPAGPIMGGSAAYAALTARALGQRVGVVTVRGNEIPLAGLDGITVIAAEAEHSTTFENVYSPAGRIQYLRQTAPSIDLATVPEVWKRARIIHLAPVAQEVASLLPADFHPTLLGLTPQGWMRAWDGDGRVRPCDWVQAEAALAQAGAAVFSVEDVAGSEDAIEQMAHAARVLAVTEGVAGARLFWHGDSRRFRAPAVAEVDPTGAGDIFATAFFVRLLNTRDPWEAARFANRMAAVSVTRRGMLGVPTVEEVRHCLAEVLD